MQKMKKSDAERYYNNKRFGNKPVKIGNICWIRVQDNEGLHEYPVEVISD